MTQSVLKRTFFDSLAKADSLFSFVQESASAGVSFWDLSNSNLIWINHKLSNLLGHTYLPSSQELNWFDLLIEEDAVFFEQLRSSQPLGDMERLVHFRKANGGLLSLHCKTKLIEPEESNECYLLCVYSEPLTKDIFEQYRFWKSSYQQINKALSRHGFSVMKIDLSGSFSFVNEFFAQTIGMHSDDLIGQRVMGYVHPDCHQRYLAIMELCLASSNSGALLKRKLAIGGAMAEWEFSMITDDTGKPQEILAMCWQHETNEEKTIELKKNKETLEDLANNLPGVVRQYTINDKGDDNIQFVSKGIEELWEIHRETALADMSTLIDKVHIDDMQGLIDSMAASMSDKSPWDYTYRVIMDDGRTKWINGRGIPKELPDGSTLWHVIDLDVTRLKNVEQNMESTNMQLELGIKTAGLGIWEMDMSTEELIWNDELHCIYGITPEEFNHHPDGWRAQVHPEDVDHANAKFGKIIKGEEVRDVRFRIYNKRTGELKHILASGMPVFNKHGAVAKLIGINIDVTNMATYEQAITESEDRYRSITNSIPGAVLRYAIRPDGSDHLLFLSKGAEDLWEMPREEILNDVGKLWGVIHPDDVVKMANSIEESSKNMSLWSLTYRIRLESKQVKWLHGRGVPMALPDGSIIWDVVVLDITERKEAEQALKKNEEQLQKLTNNVPGVIYQFEMKPNGESHFSYVSEGIQQINKDLVWKDAHEKINVFSHIHPKDKDHFFEALEESRKDLSQFDQIFRVVTTNGRVRWYHSISSPELQDDGTVIWYGIVRDINERIRAIQQSKKLAQVAEYTSDMLLTCDAKGYITWANKSHLDILGMHSEQLIGYKPAENFKAPENSIKKIADLHDALVKHVKYEVVIELHRVDGTPCWIDYQVTPVVDERGLFSYSIVCKSDVTDLMLKQRQLQTLLDKTSEQNSRLKEYSYITSHNVRASVSRILGMTQLLLIEPGNQGYLDMLRESTETLDITIKNINDLLHLEKEFRTEEKSSYDLSKGIHDIIEQNRHAIQGKQVELVLDIEPDLTLHTISAYAESIVQNLFTNALKYGVTNKSKVIEVSAIRKNSEFVFSVKDYGIGIDLEKYGHRLFKLGSRLHDISKGHGVGLFMSKNQIEALGGRIDVESKDRVGSTFTVTFPQ